MLNDFKKSLLIKGVLASALACFSLNSAIVPASAEDKKMELKKEDHKKEDKMAKKDAKKEDKKAKKDAKKEDKMAKKDAKKEVK